MKIIITIIVYGKVIIAVDGMEERNTTFQRFVRKICTCTPPLPTTGHTAARPLPLQCLDSRRFGNGLRAYTIMDSKAFPSYSLQ